MFYYKDLVDIFKDLATRHKVGFKGITSKPSWVKNRDANTVYPAFVFIPSGGGGSITDVNTSGVKDVWNLSFIVVDSLDTDSGEEKEDSTKSNMMQAGFDIMNEFLRVYLYNEDDVQLRGETLSYTVTSAHTFVQIDGETINNEYGMALSFAITSDVNMSCCFTDNFN